MQLAKRRFGLSLLLAISMSSCDSGDQKSGGEADKPLSESADRRQQGSGSAAVSASGRTAAELEAQVSERIVLLEGLEEEAFLKELEKGFKEDQALQMAVLGKWEGDLPYEKLETMMLNHFWETGWEVALSQFDLIEPNLAVSSPLLGHLMQGISHEKPDWARDWLIENHAKEGVLTGAGNVGEALYDKEKPVDGFKELWALEMPDPVIRANFVEGYVQEWVRRDFEGAFEHLSSLESDPVLDRTFYDLVHIANNVNPQDALPWAEAIEDEGYRRSAMIEVGRKWLEKDPEGYLEWRANEAPKEFLGELPTEKEEF